MSVFSKLRIAAEKGSHCCEYSPALRQPQPCGGTAVFQRFKGLIDRDQPLFYLLREKLTLLSHLPAWSHPPTPRLSPCHLQDSARRTTGGCHGDSRSPKQRGEADVL